MRFFPNNWFHVTHAEGKPHFIPSNSHQIRRLERKRIELKSLMRLILEVGEIVDLSFRRRNGQFLEGTGSR